MLMLLLDFLQYRVVQVEKLQESTRDLFNHCFQVNEGMNVCRVCSVEALSYNWYICVCRHLTFSGVNMILLCFLVPIESQWKTLFRFIKQTCSLRPETFVQSHSYRRVPDLQDGNYNTFRMA